MINKNDEIILVKDYNSNPIECKKYSVTDSIPKHGLVTIMKDGRREVFKVNDVAKINDKATVLQNKISIEFNNIKDDAEHIIKIAKAPAESLDDSNIKDMLTWIDKINSHKLPLKSMMTK